MRSTFTLALLLGIVFIATASPALAEDKGNVNPGILPPNSHAFGKTYAEWSVECLQWQLANWTASDAGCGPSKKVWFLPPKPIVGEIECTVTVPAGKAVFIPLNWVVWVNLAEYGDDPWSPDQEAKVRDGCARAIDGVSELACELDGHELGSLEAYRFSTPEGMAYMAELPEENIFSWAGIPAGTYGPSVHEGQFLMLAPLSPGTHTLHYSYAFAAFPDWGFPAGSADVTIHIQVEGGKK